jgi:hypothetical protein
MPIAILLISAPTQLMHLSQPTCWRVWFLAVATEMATNRVAAAVVMVVAVMTVAVVAGSGKGGIGGCIGDSDDGAAKTHLTTTIIEMMIEFGVSVGVGIGGVGKRLGGQHGGSWQTASSLGELACLGIFAKTPNTAKHSQLGQVMPSHTK